MGCSDKNWSRLVPVYTKNSVSLKTFFPGTPVLESATFDSGRTSFEIVNTGGTVTIERALRESDDGITWSAPAPYGVATSTVGWHHGVFGTLVGMKKYVELGVLAYAASIVDGQVNLHITTRMS